MSKKGVEIVTPMTAEELQRGMRMSCTGRVYNAEKMYTFLKGYFIGREMNEALKALGYMREHHIGQLREDGQPYEIHPLMMACIAVYLSDEENITQDVYVTILLHDVSEETGTPVDELPFSYKARRGVKYMTKMSLPDETSFELRRRHCYELLESKEATIAKAIDRYANFLTMVGALKLKRVIKNVVETDMLLLPVLRQAEQKWPELSNLLHSLRTSIQGLVETCAKIYHVKLTDPKFVNALDAIDFSYLITGAEPPAEALMALEKERVFREEFWPKWQAEHQQD